MQLILEPEKSVRKGEWKLVKQGKDMTRPWELYNLQTDRTETKNLIDQYPEKAAALKKELRSMGTKKQSIIKK